MGVRLVNRTTRRLSLTDEGLAFQARTARVLADLEDAEAEVSRGQSAAVGQLRVTTTFAFGRRFLAETVHAFQQDHPRLRVHLDASDRVVDLVEDGFDLAVRFGALADSSLITRRLADNLPVLCASPEYLDRRGRPTSLADLADHDAIVFGRPARDVWTFADNTQLQVTGALTTNDGDLAHVWALQGAGVIQKSIWEVADDVRAGRLELVLPHLPLRSEPIHAVFPPGRLTSARVRLFLAFLTISLPSVWRTQIAPVLRSSSPSYE
ncbi:LysR family transcriptional regulator [Brevundimonas sp. S30B]|uniref:LysR family transcriptional regulator n=1 Tax=Brevundimonas sp. S30B TaxID=2561925 RepID=UPI001FD7528C|nr:LysR family transcriptional regulator [Brevundimonas sp. S30B]